MMRGAWQVFTKELRDALRDRRTLLMVLLSSVALGPLLLVALSMLVAEFEARAEARDVYAVGMDTAPTLRNYIERQAWTVHAAPADHAEALEHLQKLPEIVRGLFGIRIALANQEQNVFIS